MIISALLCVFKAFSGNAGKYSCDCLAVDFNTMIAGLITVLLNGKVLEPITKLSEAMKDVFARRF